MALKAFKLTRVQTRKVHREAESMHKNIPPSEAANPQGKGLVPVLSELGSRELGANFEDTRPLGDLLKAYAVSRLILCAEFKFKPAVGQSYSLYIKNKLLRLSLIGPSEWRDGKFGTYVCQCKLHKDMTWEITSQVNKDASQVLGESLNELKSGLLSDLFSEESLKGTLPHFDERLNFHQRVLAKSLAGAVETRLSECLQSSFLQLAFESDVLSSVFSIPAIPTNQQKSNSS